MLQVGNDNMWSRQGFCFRFPRFYGDIVFVGGTPSKDAKYDVVFAFEAICRSGKCGRGVEVKVA